MVVIRGCRGYCVSGIKLNPDGRQLSSTVEAGWQLAFLNRHSPAAFPQNPHSAVAPGSAALAAMPRANSDSGCSAAEAASLC